MSTTIVGPNNYTRHSSVASRVRADAGCLHSLGSDSKYTLRSFKDLERSVRPFLFWNGEVAYHGTRSCAEIMKNSARYN
jgi:hypothetical protein